MTANVRENEKKKGMSVNYGKVIDHLTDVIKELNVGFAPCGAAAPAAPSEETRRADAVGLLKALLHVLEQESPAAAAAEHGSASQKFSKGWWNDEETGESDRSYRLFSNSKLDRFRY
jgi:hypothetical protein